jgi:hypothetical protein
MYVSDNKPAIVLQAVLDEVTTFIACGRFITNDLL